MILKVRNLTKLNRTNDDDVYLGIAGLNEIEKYNVSTLNNSVNYNEFIIISCEAFNVLTESELEVIKPVFLTELPHGKKNDEYPILFLRQSVHLSKFIESQLISLKWFDRLIEKDNKISRNSTKLMTLRSLQIILNNVFNYPLRPNCWGKLSDDLINYVKLLVYNNSYLGYLPVKKRQEFRSQNIADSTLAWEFYLKFFKEQWDCSIDKDIILPNMTQNFNIEYWKGNFFDRHNPLWEQYLGGKTKFHFTEVQKELIYEYWKEWVK